MLQYQHLLWTIFFLYPYIQNLEDLALVAIFSVLPDIDISYKKFQFLPKHIKDILNLLMRLIWTILYLPYAFLLSLFIGKSAFAHRTITHSIIPAALLAWAISYFYPHGGILAFASYITHLFLDSVTKKGVSWFYPLDIFIIKGRLNTSNILHRIIPDIVLILTWLLSLPTWLPLFLFALLIREVKLF